MVRADDRILEFLSDEGPHSPTKISEDERVRFGSEYIGRRLRENLEPHGLVKNLGNGVYNITDNGEKYLSGEIDMSEVSENKDTE